MRIVHIAQTLTPANNGQCRFSTNLTTGLVKAGHDVMMIVASNRCIPYTYDLHGVLVKNISSVPIYVKNVRLDIPINASVEILRSFTEFKPQIVHFQDHYQVSRSAVKIALRQKLPTIGTNHFLPENVLAYVTSNKRLQPYFTTFEWKTLLDVYNKLDLVISPTVTASKILRAHHLTAPMISISNGVDLLKFYPDRNIKRSQVREKYNIGEDKVVLLYVGRIDYEKRIDTLVEALKIVNNDLIRLVLVGSGGYMKEIKKLVKSLKIDNQVIFAGFLPDPDLFRLLNSVDIFVMPSDTELQSIVTLEAMAIGLPILAADAKALPELVKEGINGWLFVSQNSMDAARKIVQIMNNRDKWKLFGEASLSTAKKHDLCKTINQYIVTYSQLLNHNTFFS